MELKKTKETFSYAIFFVFLPNYIYNYNVFILLFFEGYRYMAMRLVTRSDFDGLACGALLLEAGVIDN